MNIDTKILTTKPREESGSKTSRKYQFQKDLSLYILIKEHNFRDDYLFLFDFHEDLIISNSSSSLKDLECVQIKSKDKGNWTIKDLTTQPNGKNSIIGKLYQNRIVFEDAVKSLTFISNGSYSFKNLKSGTDSKTLIEILPYDLSDDDKNECDKTIKSEHTITISEFENLGQFKVTSLSNSESSTHCVGALASLINSLNPSSKINSQLAYEQVFREITRKTNETVGDKSFKHFSEIINIKGLSKSEFIAFLQKAGLYKSVEEEWSEVKASLELDSISHLELIKFKNGWREMCARLITDSSSIPLRNLRHEIGDILIKENHNIKSLRLLGIINHIFNLITNKSYEEYFIKCLIINSINES
ncbi:MAG: dsDNA nuclease domain-containing protein [Daejeonella sp.]|uniref:dsDNA nuclease domain-containing protein n=1 Tax=Daejeonella sp. TaxID=2805397 RepID=UPI0027341A65|nr:dsDNA nuclease domain-containing protein [Daejeonella sp.]MDP3466691.1 dsDNA nuclease domain-containing protein [Daejeonella sp.]